MVSMIWYAISPVFNPQVGVFLSLVLVENPHSTLREYCITFQNL